MPEMFAPVRFRFVVALVLFACAKDEDPLDGQGGSASGTSSASGAPTSGDPTGSPSDVSVCIESCKSDDDCTVNGGYYGYHCSAGHCVGGLTLTCAGTKDNECDIIASGWYRPCTSPTECPDGTCIDIGGGVGRCAVVPRPDTGCSDFASNNEVQMPAIGGGEVTVCAALGYSCIDHHCQHRCDSDTDCEKWPGRPHCNTQLGRCECTGDADCADFAAAGFTVCKTTFCGCASNDACITLGLNSDVCVDGVCGCSGSDVCTQPYFDGTQIACAAP